MKTMLLLGSLLMTVGFASVAQSYHIEGECSALGCSDEWANTVPFVEGVCEADWTNVADLVKIAARPGNGGLCYAGPDDPPPVPPTGTDVTEFALTVTGGGTTLAWTVEVGAFRCSTTVGATAYVNDLYLYWNGGHVKMYNDDPAAPGGSYTMTPGATRPPFSMCNGVFGGPVTL